MIAVRQEERAEGPSVFAHHTCCRYPISLFHCPACVSTDQIHVTCQQSTAKVGCGRLQDGQRWVLKDDPLAVGLGPPTTFCHWFCQLDLGSIPHLCPLY